MDGKRLAVIDPGKSVKIGEILLDGHPESPYDFAVSRIGGLGIGWEPSPFPAYLLVYRGAGIPRSLTLAIVLLMRWRKTTGGHRCLRARILKRLISNQQQVGADD